MKRRIRQIVLTAICLSSWLALTTACSKEGSEQPAFTEEIAVFTSVSSSGEAISGEGEEVKACLLFWREHHYHQMLEGDFSAEPFLVSRPEEKIDYYNVSSGIPYNTKQSYPLGNGLLHVCGFAPVPLTTTDHYRTLIIPPGLQDGKTDFLSGDGSSKRVGKSSDPFVAEVGEDEDYVATNQLKQLEFCYLTSKIVVTAHRSEQMLGRIGVRGINVTLYGQKVPGKLEWKRISGREDEDLAGYFPTVPIDKNIALASQFNSPLVQTMVQRVDSCYVLAGNGDHFNVSGTTATDPGEIAMTMDISADLIPIVNGAYDYGQIRREEWKDVKVTIRSNTGAILKMGYKYEINITFDIFGIRLQGVEMEWDEGGTHYIPITPNPENKL